MRLKRACLSLVVRHFAELQPVLASRECAALPGQWGKLEHPGRETCMRTYSNPFILQISGGI